MWKEIINHLTNDSSFNTPAEIDNINRTEGILGVELPKDLTDLLSESNGIEGEYGLGLIWPIQRIESDNLSFRQSSEYAELYMPFSHLLFFADAGNGDQFAYAIHNGKNN